jgi:MFS superfamily sulfate permease-like transporter
MAAFESVAVGRALAPVGTRPRANRDCVAIGIGNLVTSLFHGMPTAGGRTQSTVNAEAGARSQLSQVVAAGMVVLSLTVLSPIFGDLPQAALGVVICVAAAGMVAPHDLATIRKIRIRDFILACVAAASVIFLGPLEGMLVTVGVSMLALLYQANRPPVYELRNWSRHGLLSIRVEGSLYFANSEHVRERITELFHEHQDQPIHVVLIESSAMRDLEYTGMESLIDIARELRANGANLWLTGMNDEPKGMLRHRMRLRRAPGVYFFSDIRQALKFYDDSHGARQAA